MNSRPAWLPEKVVICGTWNEICSMLYDIFKHDFIENHPIMRNVPVWHDKRKDAEGKYEEVFWHLTHRKNHSTGEREFDVARSRKLPWCSPVLNNSDDSSVCVWDYVDGRRVRTYLWLHDLDYVVIVEKRMVRSAQIAWLVTAYHVDGDRTRRGLTRKYEKRVL
jgi:hypothetical protein